MEENVRPLSDIPAINRFLSYCRIRTVPSKTVLIHAGDLPDVLYYIFTGSPGLIFELATQLATRLDRTNRKLGDLAFVDVTGRVAHAITSLCDEPDAMTHPEGMQIKVSRQELSRLVGCSREMAGRVLKVLEDQGLLRATGKTIVVFNARPKMKTRPVIVPAKPSKDGKPMAAPKPAFDDDDDEDDDEA